MQGLLDIEEQCRGFLELAKAATALLVKSMFSDTAFLDLFNKLCCSDDWKQGTTTASILATLADYLADFKRMLEDAFFKRYLRSCSMTATVFDMAPILAARAQHALLAAVCTLAVGAFFHSDGNEYQWNCCAF